MSFPPCDAKTLPFCDSKHLLCALLTRWLGGGRLGIHPSTVTDRARSRGEAGALVPASSSAASASASSEEALVEARRAVERVVATHEPVELAPQPPFVVAMQANLVTEARLWSTVCGVETQCWLKVLPMSAAP